MSKYYRLFLLLIVYIIGVLALIGVFLMSKINHHESFELNKIITKSMIVGIPPMLYPLYLVLFKKDKKQQK